MNQQLFSYLLPEIFVASMASIILLAGVFYQHKFKLLPYYLSLITLVVAAVLTWFVVPSIEHQVFNNSFIVDNLSCVLKIILYVLLLSIFIYSKLYIDVRDFMHAEFFCLSLFSLLGMMVLISAADFLTMFLGVELLVLPLYAMIVMVKKQAKYSEAAIKYFVIGSLGAGLLLYGISLVYGASGSFAFTTISGVTGNQHILKLGMTLVVIGIALEFGAVPFHMWLPDVYEGSPTAVTMVIGTLPKIAIFAIAYRIFTMAFPALNSSWQQILMILALLSIALGNVAAIAQINIKRMLAYSAIGHIGFILLGIFVAPQEGYIAPLFYTVVYVFMALAAFAVIMRLTSQGFEADMIEDFRGLNSRDPWLAFVMLLIMFSLAGVPPLVGFYAKFLIIDAVIDAGYNWLAIIALLFTVIAAYYYLRVVKVMYFDQPQKDIHIVPRNSMGSAAKGLVLVNGLAMLVFGMFPGIVMHVCIAAFR